MNFSFKCSFRELTPIGGVNSSIISYQTQEKTEVPYAIEISLQKGYLHTRNPCCMHERQMNVQRVHEYVLVSEDGC